MPTDGSSPCRAMTIKLKHRIITGLYHLITNIRLLLMGMRKNLVRKEDGIFYYEGGKTCQETVILIHGFADSKTGHLMVANKLLSNYRVLIPDLPGFGENHRIHQTTYSISLLSEKIIELLHEKALKNVHVLGNSLGGAVAMDIASRKPELVKSLILVGSAGFYHSDVRTVQNEIFEGNYIFQIESDDEFRKLVERVYATPPWIPSFLFSYLSTEFQAHGKWYRKLLDDLSDRSSVDHIDDDLLEISYNSRAKDFPMSTLLLWGEEDKIFPPAMAEFAHSIIPNSRLKIIKNAGHAPQHENLLDYMDALLVFLQENESSNPPTGKL